MRKGVKCLIRVALLPMLPVGLVQAQTMPQPSRGPISPPGPMSAPSKDPAAGPDSSDQVDPGHSSVVARLSHRGRLLSVLRFGVTRPAVIHAELISGGRSREGAPNTTDFTDQPMVRMTGTVTMVINAEFLKG